METYAERRGQGELAECLGRIGEGSVDAFDRFYELAAPFILGVARKILQDKMEAEDVCHDVLLEVIGGAGRYDPARGSVEAWLAVLTKSKSLDRLRRRKKIVLGEPEPSAIASAAAFGLPEQRVVGKLEKEALLRALGELPGMQRETIAAAFFGDRSQRELAAEWSVPVGTVKSRVRYGLNHLRKAMEKLGWTEREGGEGDG